MELVKGDGNGSQCCKKNVPYSFNRTNSLLQLVFYVFGRAVYNIYFHPLSKFPGPKFAAMSNVSQNQGYLQASLFDENLNTALLRKNNC